MKINKFAAVLIALTLTVTMGTTALAAEITEQNGTENTDILATYNATTLEPDTIYSVDIAWGSLEFTYSTNGIKTWDPVNHKFVVTPGTPEWTCTDGADKITVTNHSNAGIAATLEYAETNGSGVSGTFDNSQISLNAPGEGTDPSEAPSATAQLTLGGVLPESVDKMEIGSVTVMIKENIPELQISITGGKFYGVDYFFEGSYTVAFTSEINVFEVIFNMTKFTKSGGIDVELLYADCSFTFGEGLYYPNSKISVAFRNDNPDEPSSYLTRDNPVKLQFNSGVGKYMLILDMRGESKKITSFTFIG